MPITLGLLLNERNARQRRAPDPRVGVVLLERTLFDPPRAAAMRRWADQVRRSFPQARLIPYAWHLISHGPEERMRERTKRTLGGEPHRFGGLQANPQTQQAWDVTKLCVEATESRSVVVRTPPSVTPGALGRSRIRAFVDARRAEGIDVIWEPEGLWEAPIAGALAQQLDAAVILPAFAGGRALRDEGRDDLAAPGAWLRVDARQGVHGGHVDDLLDHTELNPDTVIVFSGGRAHQGLVTVAQALGL